MTGDGVNDAPALKQADVGVAMGSGTEVSKQAAAMVLTDDNFATLVHAIELGRDLWNRIVSYIRYQMIQLFGLVSLVIICTIFAINDGVPLTPVQLLFLNFLISVPPVIAIAMDVPNKGVMALPPRDPAIKVFNARTAPRWIGFGLVLGLSALAGYLLAPGEGSTTEASVPVTMAFAVMGLGTVFEALSARRDLASAFETPLLHYAAILAAPALLVVFSVEVAFMQKWLLLTSLTGAQWGIVVGLASIVFWVMEIEKLVRRRRARAGVAAVASPPVLEAQPSTE
jgi:Ca2+-transporting ATPase